MQRPYIEDVIDGSGEWRIATGDRLGRLLAESFARHWNAEVTFGSAQVGIILNSAIAGRFVGDGSGTPLAEQEAQRRNGTSDVAGGRVIYTNLDVEDHLGNPFLHGSGSDSRDARLPIFVIADPTVSLARAAAANANFPPVFPNAPIDRTPDLRLWVTDGGAIDNRGTERAVAARVGTCTPLPALHIVSLEASAFSDAYSQDRGLGSMMAAGTAFASQLDSELLADIRELYASRGQDPQQFVRFHFLPMPTMFRSSGSFGTHWMMQERIVVRQPGTCGWFRGLFAPTADSCDNETELRGQEVVTILRQLADESLPGDASARAKEIHDAIRRRDDAYSRGWMELQRALQGGS